MSAIIKKKPVMNQKTAIFLISILGSRLTIDKKGGVGRYKGGLLNRGKKYNGLLVVAVMAIGINHNRMVEGIV